MINFNKRNLSIISFVIALIIVIAINLILLEKQENEEENKTSIVLTTSLENNKTENVLPNQYKSNSEWRIEIPAINLDAPILEGTSKEVMRKAVGHFTQSSTWNGNICLAAHNRGYKYNYFQEIKKLKIGDYIKYTNTNGVRTYKVIANNVIKETDWSCINTTQDNRITLITCVENKPEYRQCVQAEQIS